MRPCLTRVGSVAALRSTTRTTWRRCSCPGSPSTASPAWPATSRSRCRRTPAPRRAPRRRARGLFRARERGRVVNPGDALGVLASARGRPEVLPQFEERPQQQAALRAVTQALNQGQKLLLEAGTGTGKSLA